MPDGGKGHGEAQARIAVVEDEFQQLVTRYKLRGRYFEERGRLAESILNFRLALELQPEDAENLAHVQSLARDLYARKRERSAIYREAFEAGQLPRARAVLTELRTLDAFDAELESEERRLGDAVRAELSRLLDSGRDSVTKGRNASANTAFRGALALDPKNESAQRYISYLVALEQERGYLRDEPFEIATPLAGFASDAQIRAEGFYQGAVVAEREGDVYSAIRQDLRALEADPTHVEARRHLEALRARNQDAVAALIEDGREAFRTEDLQQALDLWRRALLIDPDNEHARAYIDRAEHQLQNLERLRSEPDVAAAEE